MGPVRKKRSHAVRLPALDVEQEKVTVEAARLIYGVVIDPVSLQVDKEATAKLRSSPPSERYEPVINEETLEIEIKPMEAQPEAPR